MIYEAGDKVRIKTREDLAMEYLENITPNSWPTFNSQINSEIVNLDTDRILTIKEIVYENNIYGGYYLMEEIKDYNWTDNQIEEKVEGYTKKPKLPQEVGEPIESRFDILDL